ncbi:hypothetical protein BPLS_P1525 [Bathymodiolus platifrons methanotrophic gill symbiont]|nr:hypothetical protein BPLS_P1525 [Bathymodiolus platifrons methanotrophic gill symbiont]
MIICSHCDHGNSYCSGKCSAQSRQEKQREACDRYQSSSKGRHLHALRQRQYRQRKKEKVTHQGSPGLVPYDLLIVELKRVATNQTLSAPDGLIVSRRRREICQSEVRDSARGRLKFYPE